MVAFFNIKFKKAKESPKTVDTKPIKVSVEKPARGSDGVMSIKRSPESAAPEKPIISITAKETSQGKAAANPAPKQRPGQEKQPETADLEALARAMGVSVEPKSASAPIQRPRPVPPPKENDLIVSKPDPVKRRAVRKTKHDKMVEELARSLDKMAVTRARPKAKKTAKKTNKKPKRQR